MMTTLPASAVMSVEQTQRFQGADLLQVQQEPRSLVISTIVVYHNKARWRSRRTCARPSIAVCTVVRTAQPHSPSQSLQPRLASLRLPGRQQISRKASAKTTRLSARRPELEANVVFSIGIGAFEPQE
jgi:hypothetical protein